ncbi:MAG: tetratricopeptide repeat protein [Deltaproteobacteria bacterium]|nr:tetratricopeptide repeat protein [Deltaproteobacteria bacterium]
MRDEPSPSSAEGRSRRQTGVSASAFAQVVTLTSCILASAVGLSSMCPLDDLAPLADTIERWIKGPPATPPSPSHEIPPPPPAARVFGTPEPDEVQALIDSEAYESFRSVIATLRRTASGLGDESAARSIATVKARVLAALVYGQAEFPVDSDDVAALDELEQSQELNPASMGEILKVRTGLALLLGQPRTARDLVADFATEIGTEKIDKELLYLLGLAKGRLGDTKGALEALDRALVMSSSYAPALRATAELLTNPRPQNFLLRASLTCPANSRVGGRLGPASVCSGSSNRRERRWREPCISTRILRARSSRRRTSFATSPRARRDPQKRASSPPQ